MEDRNTRGNPAHVDARRIEPLTELVNQGRCFRDASRTSKQPIAQRSIGGTNVGPAKRLRAPTRFTRRFRHGCPFSNRANVIYTFLRPLRIAARGLQPQIVSAGRRGPLTVGFPAEWLARRRGSSSPQTGRKWRVGFPRRTLSMMASGSAVQVKGLGF
jgi:hypothetical protein